MAITLSDPFCVGRYRDEFLELMRSGTIDIVFANSDEVKSLYETDDFEDAARQLAEDCRIAVITRSELGSLILSSGERVDVAALAVDEVVDTTGAGDLYAAGFLHGYAQGKPLDHLRQARQSRRRPGDPADRTSAAAFAQGRRTRGRSRLIYITSSGGRPGLGL